MRDILAVRLGSERLRQDSVFSWVVCICSFISHVFHVGYSFAVVGILQIEQQRFLGIDGFVSSWIVSVHLCMLFVGGLPASILIKKTSVRTVQVVGGIFLILGQVLCVISTRPWHLFVLFGFVAGIGSSFGYTASSEILRHHFKKHIYLASAIAASGTFGGLCALPPLIQTIFSAQPFNVAMGTMSTFHVVHLVVSLVYIESAKGPADESWTRQEGVCRKDSTASAEKVSAEDSEEHEKLAGTGSAEKVSVQEHANPPGVPHRPALGLQLLSLLKRNRDYTYPVIVHPNKTAAGLVRLFLCSALFWNFSAGSFFALISGYIIDKLDLTEEQAAVGMSINGGVSLVGVVLVSACSQLSFDRLVVHALGPAVFGICTIAVLYSTTLVHYYTSQVIYGISMGVLIANLLSVSYDLCGPEQMVLLFTLELFAEGVGALIGPPVCALIAEKIGKKSGLIVSGTCAIFAALLILVAIIQGAVKRSRARKLPQHVRDENHTEDAEGGTQLYVPAVETVTQ